MKIVINKCYGGFSLSKAATRRMAELEGRPCYFFKTESSNLNKYVPIGENDPESLFWLAFDIPNPNEVLIDQSNWASMPQEQRESANRLHRKHQLENRPENRTCPRLIQVVEELGCEAASGKLAKLAIVEIPDGVEWEIDEYDGIERIAEVHRTWG